MKKTNAVKDLLLASSLLKFDKRIKGITELTSNTSIKLRLSYPSLKVKPNGKSLLGFRIAT
jgi:hypothetical protein